MVFFPLWPLQKVLNKRKTQRKMRQIQRAYNVSCETSEHIFLPHVDHKAGCVEKFYSQVFSYPFKNKFNLLTYAFCFLAKKIKRLMTLAQMRCFDVFFEVLEYALWTIQLP